MYKSLLLIFITITATHAYGQSDSLTIEERRILDSMFRNDEFIKLMMGKEKSYIDLGIGMGNTVFSLKNNALNAGQAQTNKLYYTPSVGYFHKSGLAISINGYLATDEGKLKMYQWAISPSYTFINKKITAGISYTRFIRGSEASFDMSPFKNDFYASVVYKKTWIQPGLAAGYSFGKQTEYYDSAFWFSPQPPANPRVIYLRDTITTKISGFSLTLSASHTWSFWELLHKQDGLQLRPAFMLNAASQHWNTTHSSRLFTHFPRLANYLKRRFGDGSGSDKFNLQSLAFAGSVSYFFGKFYLLPQLYLDYYLPSTTEKRLTALFSLTAGVSLY